jgi:hypothetical protein
VLVGRAIAARKPRAAKARVNLGDGGATRRNRPAIEGPEVDTVAELAAQEQQPRNAGVRRLRDRALNIKVEDGLRRACPRLGQTAPAPVAGARGAGAGHAFAHEIDVRVRRVRRPMALEVFEEHWPARRRRYLDGIALALCRVDTERLEARLGRLGAGVVDADVT